MKDIWRNCIYQGKNMFRDKNFIFWGLLYPIILSFFFYTAFSGITNYEIEDINVGVEKGSQAYQILNSIDVLNLVEISKDHIEQSLNNEEIDAYVKDDYSLVVNASGLNQTIVKGILDQIKQTRSLDEPIESFDFEVDYLVGKTQEANGILVIFYSLIAMVSTYGVFAGIESALIVQANISNIGARINISPIKKSTFLISGVIVGLFINMLSNILLLLFIEFVLKLDLLRNIGYSSVFIILGNMFGVSLGLFIGSSNKKSAGFKSMLSIVITLFLSFLSGLMSQGVKIFIDKNIPWLSKINPIAIITNNLYKINLLENTKDLNLGIVLLASYSLILMLGSYVFLRRSQFDSI